LLDKKKIEAILSSNIEEISSLEIPHFSLLSDIKKATLRISQAIDNKEKIVIVGDYDVDGVVSSALMKLFFEKMGVDVEVVIPNRFEEGYGLSLKLLNRISADLIITVDNGITSFEAAKECKRRGIDLIITDHHSVVEKLPEAFAIVNPKISEDFPFKEICGAEVAWYLCAAIKHKRNLNIDLREFLDMLVIAIIADVMPLTHMNRKLTQMGLKRLKVSNKPFVLAIKEFFPFKDFNSEFIAFQIAPRLNAAGRMADAMIAYEFLISKDYERAYNLFLELDRLNNLRKETELEILESIEVADEDFIVSYGDYHEGVIGIVASRLVNKYKKPAIVFSEKDGVLKGSGRSLGNIDIFDLVLKTEDLLENFGGHKLACGLSLKKENILEFKNRIQKEINKYKSSDFFIGDNVLGELLFSEIDEELIQIIEKFEPYGEGNKKPKFISSVNFESVENIKDNHFRVVVSQNSIFFRGVIFRYDKEIPNRGIIKYSLSRFNSEIQLLIEEIL
jgi:single-stranded-DNA-specific exonuclease